MTLSSCQCCEATHCWVAVPVAVRHSAVFRTTSSTTSTETPECKPVGLITPLCVNGLRGGWQGNGGGRTDIGIVIKGQHTAHLINQAKTNGKAQPRALVNFFR